MERRIQTRTSTKLLKISKATAKQSKYEEPCEGKLQAWFREGGILTDMTYI